jgi:hypothetical protein
VGLLTGEGVMVIYPRRRIKMGQGMGGPRIRPKSTSPRQTEDHEQCAIKLLGCFPVNLADDAPNPVKAQCDHLVRHNLRAKAESVGRFRFDDRPERQSFLKV